MMFFSDPPAPSAARPDLASERLRTEGHRGLENETGANHCFLNVVIQALWNLQSFRRRLLRAPWHQHEAHEVDGKYEQGISSSSSSCCYCALKSVFKDFASSDADTIPPDALRQALSSVYDAKGRFKTGEMEDATETWVGCLL